MALLSLREKSVEVTVLSAREASTCKPAPKEWERSYIKYIQEEIKLDSWFPSNYF